MHPQDTPRGVSRRTLSAAAAIFIAILLMGGGSSTAQRLQAQPGEHPGQVKEIPGSQYVPPPPAAGEQTLILPPAWKPTQEEPMPPVPKALAQIQLPNAYIGCWQGTPEGYDRVFDVAPQGYPIGQPGAITFCYHPTYIEVPIAEVVVPAAKRALEVTMTLGLGYASYVAHGIHTDVYSVGETQIRGRSTLEVDPTFHLLFLIPIDVTPQATKVDWIAGPTDRGTIELHAYQVLFINGKLMFAATWHAEFHRVADPRDS
jgi:hypothetical protein